MYDFLVDIVAREDVEDTTKTLTGAGRKRKASTSGLKTGGEEKKKGKGKKKVKVEEMSDEAWSEEEDDDEVDHTPVKESKRVKRKTRPAKSVSYDLESVEDELAEEVEGGSQGVESGGLEGPAMTVAAGPCAPAPFMTSVRTFSHSSQMTRLILSHRRAIRDKLDRSADEPICDSVASVISYHITLHLPRLIIRPHPAPPAAPLSERT